MTAWKPGAKIFTCHPVDVQRTAEANIEAHEAFEAQIATTGTEPFALVIVGEPAVLEIHAPHGLHVETGT